MRLLTSSIALALAISTSAICDAAAAKGTTKAGASKAGANAKTAAAQTAKIAGFNATDPDGLIALLKTMGAEAKVIKTENGLVFLSVAAKALGFGAQMMGCDPKGKSCHAEVFFTVLDKKSLTLPQLNVFNSSQPICRAVQGADGNISLMYFALLSPRLSQDDARQNLGAWSGCLTNFGEFAKDPESFAAKANKGG